jgi:hypothetical protein
MTLEERDDVRVFVHVISAFFSNLLGHVFSSFHLLLDWKLDDCGWAGIHGEQKGGCWFDWL